MDNRNKEHECVIRSKLQQQESLYYKNLRVYRSYNTVESQTRYVIASFELNLPIPFFRILEAVMTIWFGALRPPRDIDRIIYNTSAVISLAKDIQDTLCLAEPSWKPLNTAFQLLQGCVSQGTRPHGICPVPHCGIRERTDTRFRQLNFNGVPAELLEQYVCSACWFWIKKEGKFLLRVSSIIAKRCGDTVFALFFLGLNLESYDAVCLDVPR